jgi:hypothetical protein
MIIIDKLKEKKRTGKKCSVFFFVCNKKMKNKILGFLLILLILHFIINSDAIPLFAKKSTFLILTSK